jgi:hypothetical protein
MNGFMIRIGRGDRRGVLGCIVGQENNNERRARWKEAPLKQRAFLFCLEHHDLIFENHG